MKGLFLVKMKRNPNKIWQVSVLTTKELFLVR